jgi:hypothetical protein
MKPILEDKISCAIICERCDKKLNLEDKRILSVYDHKTICMDCKKIEEERPDYATVSKDMINQCLVDTEQQWADPENFCFYHFYPFKC